MNKSLLPWKRGVAGERDPFAVLRREMNSLFDDFFTDVERPPALALPAFSPKVDVKETDGELRVTAELPGVDEKDVELSIDGSTLIVKGEKHATARAENEGVLHAERTHGAFQRALELPVEIDANAVQARLEHGLLVISLPKSEKAKPRKIEVKRG